ncbi:MAG: hypothetical protein K2Y08_01495 [Alphaproteobacteria bacterium]|nr:hypothetical protein [Alphaproteobacteria bacterium]
MLKNFLRTSVLTLGAGLCVLATLQRESHATEFDNKFNDTSTVSTRVYVKYRDQNNQEQVQVGATQRALVGARTKTSLNESDVESTIDPLIEEALANGGTHLKYGVSVTVHVMDEGKLESKTLDREANDFSGLKAIMQKPLETFSSPAPIEGITLREIGSNQP